MKANTRSAPRACWATGTSAGSRYSSDWRGLKVGDALMRAAIEEAERRGLKRQLLTAQVYAIPFYERLGFKVDSGEFLDAGLPHVDMVRDSD